ncbi:MAG: DUF998 domain-containing protein [Methanomassiliicoccaceae archaeon]|nr:DUF998 domain-containing protein [Methanomassiliicoccaceae archaeon]
MKALKDNSIAFSWFGIIGVAVFIIAWMCAASIDATWQFGVNTLSEFGISDTDASYYFNYGCRITGILIVVTGIGRVLYSKNAGYTIGGILLAVGGFFLALVGVYTMDTDAHSLVAVCMAVFLFAAIIAIAAGNWAADRKVFAGVGIASAFILFVLAIAGDTAVLEAYGIIVAMIWFLAESVNVILYRRKD